MAGAKTTDPARTADAGQDRFLKLLVTQLKNQDPLNPLNNSEVTSQLAQISTVQGIEKLNTTLGAMAGSYDSGQTLQAAGLVGRQVLVAGDALELGGAGSSGAFSLPQPVDRLSISITDASGVVVHRVELGAQAAGTQVFNWDGMTDAGGRGIDGRYRFSVNAAANGKTVSAETYALGRIDGVTRAADGTVLNLGSLGNKALSEVKRIM
ncbi:MAG: flagellar hook assembly protein FlgD [Betaproteobacteria bacterium]|nr:flagellar hook assembly protein FlgD [Betaproteobacteria bacterium]